MKRLERLTAELEERKRLEAVKRPIKFSDYLLERITAGLETGECSTCTRPLLPRTHCFNCGAMGLYAKPSKSTPRNLPNGDIILPMTFTCRRCGATFDEVDTYLNCKALAPESMKTVRSVAKAASIVGVDNSALADFARALRKQKEAEGLLPTTGDTNESPD